MRDRDIRSALHSTELRPFAEDGHSLVLDEMGICAGDFRVDIAVVNGALHGYEIKSDRDTLGRLPAQADAYSRVFDTMTLVVGAAHAVRAIEIVPAWWSILLASPVVDGASLECIRPGGVNPGQDPHAVAQLLWREEAVALLRARGFPPRSLRGSRKLMWRTLADLLPLQELAAEVRQILKLRQGWRSPTRPAAAS